MPSLWIGRCHVKKKKKKGSTRKLTGIVFLRATLSPASQFLCAWPFFSWPFAGNSNAKTFDSQQLGLGNCSAFSYTADIHEKQFLCELTSLFLPAAQQRTEKDLPGTKRPDGEQDSSERGRRRRWWSHVCVQGKELVREWQTQGQGDILYYIFRKCT